MSDYISKQRDVLLTEGREYFMCNSNAVDKVHYQSQLKKKSLALVTAATYRTDLGLNEDQLNLGEEGLPCVNQEQRDQKHAGGRGSKENGVPTEGSREGCQGQTYTGQVHHQQG